MRKTHNPEIVRDDLGCVVGVSLGADCISEHEWGISKLAHTFGIDNRSHIIGGDRYLTNSLAKVTEVPNAYSWFSVKVKKKTFAGFYSHRSAWYDFGAELAKNVEQALAQHEIYFHTAKHHALQAAWDEDSFIVVGTEKDTRAALREIYDTTITLDKAYLFLAGGGVFKNSGLCFAIPNAMPQNVLDQWKSRHEEVLRTQKAADETGIIARLAKANRKYFACRPSIFADGSLKFWLNPYDQKNNNTGWYSVEDLDAWILGSGPVPVKASR